MMGLAGLSMAAMLCACGSSKEAANPGAEDKGNSSAEGNNGVDGSSNTEGSDGKGAALAGGSVSLDRGVSGSEGLSGDATSGMAAEIFNNGGRFVKNQTSNEVYYVTDAALCAYDETVGTERELTPMDLEMQEGSVKLFYLKGWIYYSLYSTEKENTYVYRVSEKGGTPEEVKQGFVDGVSADGSCLMIQTIEDSRCVENLYDGEKFLQAYHGEDGEDIYFAGAFGDHIFMVGDTYQADQEKHRILTVNINDPEKILELGEIPAPDEETTWIASPAITQVITEGDKAYISISYYAGSGMYFNFGKVCEADLTKEGSLKVLKAKDYAAPATEKAELFDEAGELNSEAYLWIRDGKLQVGPGIPDTAKFTEDYAIGGIRRFDEEGWAHMVEAPDLLREPDPHCFISERLEDVVYMDGAYYFSKVVQMDDPSQAIGWRNYYQTVYWEYDKLEEDGKLTVMHEGPEGYVANGYIALGKDDSYIYFQPTRIYEDAEGGSSEESSPEYARMIVAEPNVVISWEAFLNEDASNGKPLSALEEFGVGTKGGEEESEGYFSIPQGTLSDMRFLLRLNKEGHIISIAPDNAG